MLDTGPNSGYRLPSLVVHKKSGLGVECNSYLVITEQRVQEYKGAGISLVSSPSRITRSKGDRFNLILMLASYDNNDDYAWQSIDY